MNTIYDFLAKYWWVVLIAIIVIFYLTLKVMDKQSQTIGSLTPW